MGYELTVFVIMTILILIAGIANVFHFRSKKESTNNQKTAFGLIDLTLGAWAVVTLLIMGGLI